MFVQLVPVGFALAVNLHDNVTGDMYIQRYIVFKTTLQTHWTQKLTSLGRDIHLIHLRIVLFRSL